VMSAEKLCSSIWIRKVGLKVSMSIRQSPVGPPEGQTPPDTYQRRTRDVRNGFRR
jgi:hypothetical protein